MSAQAVVLQYGTLDGVCGWLVSVPRGRSEWLYGPYATREDAQSVAARLTKALEVQDCTDA